MIRGVPWGPMGFPGVPRTAGRLINEAPPGSPGPGSAGPWVHGPMGLKAHGPQCPWPKAHGPRPILVLFSKRYLSMAFLKLRSLSPNGSRINHFGRNWVEMKPNRLIKPFRPVLERFSGLKKSKNQKMNKKSFQAALGTNCLRQASCQHCWRILFLICLFKSGVAGTGRPPANEFYQMAWLGLAGGSELSLPSPYTCWAVLSK